MLQRLGTALSSLNPSRGLGLTRSLTDAEMEGRENVMHALDALRHTVPGFEIPGYGKDVDVYSEGLGVVPCQTLKQPGVLIPF